jgi:hypothetical protein
VGLSTLEAQSARKSLLEKINEERYWNRQTILFKKVSQCYITDNFVCGNTGWTALWKAGESSIAKI